MSKAAVEKSGAAPLARVIGMADSEAAPIDFSTAPAGAVVKALESAGISKDDVDVWEVNEAFSLVALANQKLLGIDSDKINPHGGAVSLGHPIGASGARITGSLALQMEPGQIGCASICNGGGGASAIIIE